jgi:site-specific DNA-methyltransferase (adenine-specific)
MKITNIKPNPNNPRIIKDDKFQKLVQSIKDFPEMMEKRPIVCVTDVDGKIYPLGGNMRFKALKELNYKDIPDNWVTLADDWTEEKRREFVIKDNVGFGEWDWEQLANDWDNEELEAWGLDVPSFETDEVLEAEEDDFDTTPPEEPITVLGDLYEIGEHRLLCGDSTDSDQVAKLMNGSKADMVFTDPPYGVSYTGGHNKKQRTGIIADELQGEDLSSLFEDSINTACIFSKDSAPFYIWYAGGKSKETYLGLSKTPIEVRAVICWYKVKSGSGAFMSQYIPNYEPCIYGHKQGKTIQWFGATDEKTVWEFKKDNTNDYHPTQKPIDVVERALNNSSKKGQLIYDAFGGSGSTMVGSHQLKRIANLMELDPKYCDVIVKRMIKLDPTLMVKRNGIDCKSDFE